MGPTDLRTKRAEVTTTDEGVRLVLWNREGEIVEVLEGQLRIVRDLVKATGDTERYALALDALKSADFYGNTLDSLRLTELADGGAFVAVRLR